jgi:hypothetical protein
MSAIIQSIFNTLPNTMRNVQAMSLAEWEAYVEDRLPNYTQTEEEEEAGTVYTVLEVYYNERFEDVSE